MTSAPNLLALALDVANFFKPFGQYGTTHKNGNAHCISPGLPPFLLHFGNSIFHGMETMEPDR